MLSSESFKNWVFQFDLCFFISRTFSKVPHACKQSAYLKAGEICLCIQRNVPVLYNSKPTCKNMIAHFSSLRPSQRFTERPSAPAHLPGCNCYWSTLLVEFALVVGLSNHESFKYSIAQMSKSLSGAREPN